MRRTKTSGAEGIHLLAPIVVARLRRRFDEQTAKWRYEGAVMSLVFTTSTGGLVNRQGVTKGDPIVPHDLTDSSPRASSPTPAGERSSRLCTRTAESLAEVARHVGRSKTSTTAG